MAFNIDLERHFEHELKNLPGGRDGARQSMKVTYRVLDDVAAEGVNIVDVEKTKDFLRAAVVDIADLVTEDGRPVTYGPPVLEALMASLDLRMALTRGYGLGLAKAASGN